MSTPNFKVSSQIEIIINQETRLGNRIIESSKGWQNEESTLIILEKPFNKRYNISNLKYRYLNDPHYWKEEYEDKENMQTLACRF